MKYKTAELTGELLDVSVAKAIGLTAETAFEFGLGCPDWLTAFKPSRVWMHGGPIIEREKISVEWDHRSVACTEWEADFVHYSRDDGVGRTWALGPTALVAAMRAFVSSRLGDEVDL